MASDPGSRLRTARDAALQLQVLSAVAAAGRLDDLVEPLGAALRLLSLHSCRLALIEPGPRAFAVREAITCDATGARLPETDPMLFARGDPMTEAIFSGGEPTLWLPHADGRRASSARALKLWADGDGVGMSVATRAAEGWLVSLCVTAPNEEPALAFEARTTSLTPRLRLIVDAATHPAAKIIARRPKPSLSPGEAAVLALLADGLRPAEIAQRRGASEATVRNQVAALRRKLGAQSNAHAVAIGLRAGVILN